MEETCIGEEYLKVSPNEEMRVKYYILAEDKIYTELKLEMKTYGVKIESFKDDYFERNEVKDITIDRKKIVQISHLLKKNQVLPEHLKDIIEDFV